MTLNFEAEVNVPFDFDVEALAGEVINFTLEHEDFPYEPEVNLTLVDNEGIHAINKEFREIDRPTDVLSFPMLSYENAGDFSKLEDDYDDNLERITFHPDYSYANFVGTYKPVPIKSDEKDAITYAYVPGPFMRIYVEALKNSRTDRVKPFLLLIEEINRANVAAVFGDIFQLLDRDSNNVSSKRNA